jgi:hypothetical protein
MSLTFRKLRHCAVLFLAVVAAGACAQSNENEVAIEIRASPLKTQITSERCDQGFCLAVEDGVIFHGVDSFWESPAGVLWASGFDAGIIRKNGKLWENWEYIGTFPAIWGASESDVWAVGDDVIHWDGSKWSSRKAGLEDHKGLLWSVWGSGSDNIWAVGEFGMVANWNGKHWTSRKIGDSDIQRVTGTSATNVWLIGRPDILARWDGKEWTNISRPSGEYASIWVGSKNDVWIGGFDSIAHWDGKAWLVQKVDGIVNSIHGNRARLFATGLRGNGAFLMQWDGKIWRDVVIPDLIAKQSVWEGRVVFLDSRGTLWLSTYAGAILTKQK